MIERAVLAESLSQFGVGTWVETWEADETYIFIVTDLRDGSRHVYTGEAPGDWRDIVPEDAPGRFPTDPPPEAA